MWLFSLWQSVFYGLCSNGSSVHAQVWEVEPHERNNLQSHSRVTCKAQSEVPNDNKWDGMTLEDSLDYIFSFTALLLTS